jgi:hypothetical protein
MDLEPKERLETVAAAVISAVKTQTVAEAGEEPTPMLADVDMVQTLIED